MIFKINVLKHLFFNLISRFHYYFYSQLYKCQGQIKDDGAINNVYFQ